MSRYDPKRPFDPNRDIRDWDDLFACVIRESPGLWWPILGTRRSGKTWALKALLHRAEADGRDAQYLDLRECCGGTTPESCLPEDCTSKLILLDEVSSFLFNGDHSRANKERQDALFQWCKAHKNRGARIVAAITPAEWAGLPTRGQYRVDSQALNGDALAPLAPAQARKIALDDPPRAGFVEKLIVGGSHWIRSPMLLSTLLHIHTKHPGKSTDDLVMHACDYLEQEFDYTEWVLAGSFNATQLDVLRAISRQVQPDPRGLDLISRAGVVLEADESFEIVDPLLAKHFPPPIRIHHISDLHFGSKTAEVVDQKDASPLGTTLADGMALGPVREGYLDWLSTLAPFRRPNIAVVSGDVAEFSAKDEFEEARAWLTRLRSEFTEEHAELQGKPRVLLVGGNHDVDRSVEQTPPELRHQCFAEAFPRAEWPRPGLELPIVDADRAAHLRFGEASVEFALLGSAQFGSEGDEASRADPGHVHGNDVRRLREQSWVEAVRIAVLHHPLTPVPGNYEVTPYAGLVNAAQLKDALFEKGFNVVLHGHVHIGWVGVETWPNHHDGEPIAIVSAPTLGSRLTYENHGFNEISIFREGSKRSVEITSYIRKGQAFQPAGKPIVVSIQRPI